MNTAPTIVWFYHDLRLSDHSALSQAAQRGPVIPLYIHDGLLREGGASKWWLHNALENLLKDFARAGTPFILKQGDPLSVLRQLIKETGAQSVTWSRRYEPELAVRDDKISGALRAEGVDVSIHSGFLLFEPEEIHTQSHTPFKVFTPFSKACFAAPAPLSPLPAPKKMRGVDGIESDDLNAWGLIPKKAKWTDGLKKAWKAGEKAASERLHDFIEESLTAYKGSRDRPDIVGTSRLSPYLHFGHISPRQLWHAMMRAQIQDAAASSIQRYLLELLWREFSWHLLHHIPSLTTKPLQPSFADFPWHSDKKGLQAWQRGLTGYPLIDAGMRELWQTGWMHNRVRMLTASFLIKDLLIDWREGMAWFWDTLVDADLGSNTASWQWVAGCGADAAPYFRIFNPVLQGQKFDPHGHYVRTYVPELAKLEDAYIHEPWKAPAAVLAKAGVVLGKNYPLPLLDHHAARQRALDVLKAHKTTSPAALQKAPKAKPGK